MLKPIVLWICCCCWATSVALAGDYTSEEARAAWAHWKHQPVTESNFLAICDLLQDIGKNNINISYEILSEYVPEVKKTGNKAWVHILLMGWAKAKESLAYFAEADSLYRQALNNAAGDSHRFDEVMVGMSLMYAEWGKTDSLDKYIFMGKRSAARTGDMENLSFLYTFGAMGHLTDTVAMGQSLTEAMRLATGLANKNALFTARYNYASIYCRSDPQRQVAILESLLELAKDSTLTHKPKLYERTDFYFRNATPSIYAQLVQVNLLLADYDNAGKFAELLYDAVVRPNPAAPQAPYFNSELAMIKAYQGRYDSARQYLQRSRDLFRVPEEKIPYASYFLAAGMVAEHDGKDEQALHDYEIAYKMGSMEGVHLMPSELYYAHELIRLHRLNEADRVLATLRPALPARLYTAYGFYFYKHQAELLKAKGDYAGYGKALEQFYAIKDSLTSLNHYRAIQEIEAKVRLRDKEQQIIRLNEENEARIRNSRRERMYFSVFLGLSGLLVLLLVGYSRNLYVRRKQAMAIARQKEALQENRMREMERQHRIGIMQGAIDAEERERRKIADQLHDEVGGMLSLATLNLSSTLEKGRGDVNSEQKLHKAQEILFSVATTIRELSHQLTPLMIEKYGFRHAVEDMVETINLSQKLMVKAVIVGFDDISGYQASFLNDLYRMLQEMLHNIVKHAQATFALLELVEHSGQVSILVEDDGVGIDENRAVKGKGLDTIRSKIAYLNGRIEIGQKREKGTLIVIELPIAKDVNDVNERKDAFENYYSG
jgi:signal transduction histidine kinase